MLLQWLTVGSSLVSLAWAITAYNKTMSIVDKETKISIKGVVLLFLWRLFTVLSRVLGFVVSAVYSGYALLGICLFHVVLSGMFFCRFRRFIDDKKSTVNVIINTIYGCIIVLFISFPLQQINMLHTRLQYLYFHSWIFIENVCALVLWLIFKSFDVQLVLKCLIPIAIIGGYILGVVLQIIYYIYFHPTKRLGESIKFKIPMKEWRE